MEGSVHQGRTIPPSPNWYLPQILDVSVDDTVCYGSHTSLVMLKVTNLGNSPKISQIDIIKFAHAERVTAVVCAHRGMNTAMVATIGGDSYVKVWDLTTKKLCMVHEAHGENSKLRGLDWAGMSRDEIISVDDAGVIVRFSVRAKKTDKVVFPKLRATILACCPHKSELVAVGESSGLVMVLNIMGSGSVVHRMRGHDHAVISLSWCPDLGNKFLPEPVAPGTEVFAPEMLLASAASTHSIFIWRAGSDGRSQIEIVLPTTPAPGSKHRTTLPSINNQGAYTTIFWALPEKLLSSTAFGELLAWDLNFIAQWQIEHENTILKGPTALCCSEILSQAHQRGLFSISCNKVALLADRPGYPPSRATTLYRLMTRDNDPAGPLVWSTSQDRQLVCTSLDQNAPALVLPTIGGFVYCMAASSLDSHKLAIGAGDGTIRVWNIANTQTIELRSVWLKIKGRVTSLAWHPVNESWLAYGTSEGRVGIYDMASSVHGPLRIWAFHKKSVYTVGWGPRGLTAGEPKDASLRHCLYTCGDNELLCCDVAKDQNLANVQTTIYKGQEKLQVKVTDFSWRQDFSCLAVGTDTGCVHICLAPYLKVMRTVNPHKKMIQSLAWHPINTTCGRVEESMSCLMAFAATVSVVKVFNFASLFSKMGDKEIVDTLVVDRDSQYTTITGHSDRVTQVVWSPHIAGLLATCSYDGTAQVWDFRGTPKLLGMYKMHTSWLYCVAWYPLHADFLLTGSKDFTVRSWRLSSQMAEPRPNQTSLEPREQLPLPTIEYCEPAAAAESTGKLPPRPVAAHEPAPAPASAQASAQASVHEAAAQAASVAVRPAELAHDVPVVQEPAWVSAVTPRAPRAHESASAQGPAWVSAVTPKAPHAHESPSAQGSAWAPATAHRLASEPNWPPQPQWAPTLERAPLPAKNRRAVADTEGASVLKKSHFPWSSRCRNVGKEKVIASTYCLLKGKKMMANVKEEPSESLIGSGQLAHLGFFSDMTAMNRMLDLEEEHLNKANLPTQALNVGVWRTSDYTDLIERAIQDKRVTLWHVSLAPTVSTRLWRDTAIVYAEQLRDAGRYQEAASMLLTVRLARRAVDMLLAQNLFREAVCIVRFQLAEETGLLHHVFNLWARHAETVGDYELAAQCLIAIEEFEHAAMVQGQRKDGSSLTLATTLAVHSDVSHLVILMGEQAIQKHLTEGKYIKARTMANTHLLLRPWIWLILTHEELIISIEKSANAAAIGVIVRQWINMSDEFADNVLMEIKASSESLYKPQSHADLRQICSGIDTNPKTKHEVHLFVAAQIAASLVCKDWRLQYRYLIEAFSVCYRYHEAFPQSRLLVAVIMFALPCRDCQSQLAIDPYGLSVTVSAYFCVGLTRWFDHDLAFMREECNQLGTDLLEILVFAIQGMYEQVIDLDTMFYYDAISKMQEYEKMSLPGGKSLDARQTEDLLENCLNDLSLTSCDEEYSVCSEHGEVNLETHPMLTRLRQLQADFVKKRISAPDPYQYREDLLQALKRHSDVSYVATLAADFECTWADQMSKLENMWKTMVFTTDESAYADPYVAPL